MDPTTIAGAVFSGLNALLKITQQGAHFASVTHEVKQLLINVLLTKDAINTARRLLRLNIYIDDGLRSETLRSIEHTETILLLIRDTIEGCRHDIEVKKSVSIWNRTAWVMHQSQEFSSKLGTLTNALQCLNRDIIRMETAQLPAFKVTSATGSVVVASGLNNEYEEHIGFSRSPTMRRRMARSSNQSLGGTNLNHGNPQIQYSSANSSSLTLVDDNRMHGVELDTGTSLGDSIRPGLTHIITAPAAIRWEDTRLLDVNYQGAPPNISGNSGLHGEGNMPTRSATSRRRSNLM